ncbi:sensor histidine kinase [Clostridium sp. AF15-17LB]|nr:sensor histidine kinase [Clostridium sp. AF15-17LB]
MFKNREILYAILFIIILSALSAAACVHVPASGGYVVLADGILYIACFSVFARYRYGKLRKLSEFLRKAQMHMLPLEVPDQMEGELSVLKSELYKLLTTCHSQSELLQQDRQFLADTISDISHQLKTPMTSMNVMVDLLKDEALPPQKRLEFTRALHTQLSRMEWLLSAMLTMSRIDAGAIKLKKETVKVSDLIRQASEHLLIPMELRGQHLAVPAETSAVFMGDLHWSSEAVSNILKNCMEHTPRGGTITIDAWENPLYTGITIQDEGGGISEKDSPHVFERFYRGSNASPDSVGIGLALAKQLITAQDGAIEMESVYGSYTVFKIKFYHCNM